ncbi:MAG: DUF502 domain-containing protein [Chitinophagaceae bacterium]
MKFLSKTIAGGVLFLIPLVVLVVILEKALTIIHKLLNPLLKSFPNNMIGGIGVHELIAACILIIICFLAGLLASTSAAKSLIKMLETKVLSLIPGYSFIQTLLGTPAGADKNMPVVIVQFDDYSQLAFLVDELDDGNKMIYIPSSPTPLSGGIFIVESDRVKPSSLTSKQAMRLMTQVGRGAAGYRFKV